MRSDEIIIQAHQKQSALAAESAQAADAADSTNTADSGKPPVSDPVQSELAEAFTSRRPRSLRDAKAAKLAAAAAAKQQLKAMHRRADVIVTEIFDSELLGEGILPTMRHAVKHLLQVCPQPVAPSGHLHHMADAHSDVCSRKHDITTYASDSTATWYDF